jgi:LemA protein
MVAALVFLGFIAFIVIGFLAWGIGIYNNLVAIRNNVDKAWANIDVILKQRHDELPKLIDTCKGYMKHEQTLLENVTRARTSFMSAPDVGAKTEAENVLNSSLRSLFAVAENYPELKANQNFLDLQNRISALEESIADRREFFNEATTIYNTKIQSFPDMFFANMLQMLKRPLLEIPKAETEDVKISFS